MSTRFPGRYGFALSVVMRTVVGSTALTSVMDSRRTVYGLGLPGIDFARSSE